MQTLIIGHRNPDMDAICSAIAYAEFKRATGQSNVVAGRCGNTNARIDYALNRFGFPTPPFFTDVRPAVHDVMEREVVSARVDEPVYSAFARIGEQKFRGLPVVDEVGRCAGLVSGLKISRHVFPDVDQANRSREVHASLDAIATTVEAEVIVGEPDQELRNHILIVVAMQTDTFRRRLDQIDRKRGILIVGDRRNIQNLAINAGVRALLLTSGMRLDEEQIEAARQSGTVVLSSKWDTATTVLLARSSVRTDELLNEDVLSLEADLSLEEARQRMIMTPQFTFPVVDDDGMLAGVLSKSDFLKPVPRQLILVDHNELSQAVAGASQLPIVEILDHHRIGATATSQPILFYNRPVGSTCSIVADCYEREGIPIPAPVAGLLMCGLISDTLNLTSPTTTVFDRKLMLRLAEISHTDPNQLAESIFEVGSPLLTMSAEEAVTADCKEYDEAGIRFSVAQIEELTFARFEKKRIELLEALEHYRARQTLEFSALMVTDINTQNSFLLARGEGRFLDRIDFPDHADFTWRLDGIVSRKKQLLPYLSALIVSRSG